MPRLAARLAAVALTGCLLSLAPHQALAQQKPATAEKSAEKPGADVNAMLRRMHEFMKSNDLDFEARFTANDAVLGKEFSGKADFAIRQPNLFRITVTSGGKSDLFVSDGKDLWIYRKASGKYARFATKDNVLGTMYAAAGLMFMPSRILDAFWTVDYLETVKEDVRTKSIPDMTVSGRSCRGIRVTRFEDEFDLWIDAAPPHKPCRLVSRRTDGSSQSRNTHTFTWRDAASLSPATFRFDPPKGARQTDNSDPQ